MKPSEASLQHDLFASVQKIQNFIDLVESGYDFTETSGKVVIHTAKDAIGFLERIILEDSAS